MTNRRKCDQPPGRATLALDKLSFRKGVIGEDLDRCPDCVWDEDYIVEYCKPCEDSVDLMIEFLSDSLEKRSETP